MDEEASMLVRMINNSIESSYGVPNFFEPQLLIRIMNGNIPSPVFFLKMMSEIENSMSFISQYMPGPKPDPNNIVNQFKSYLSDQRMIKNPKIFSLFDELWQKGPVHIFVPIVNLPDKRLDLYTWLMNLRIDTPLYQHFFKSFPTSKTLKDVVLMELKNKRDLMSRKSKLMLINELYTNIELKKFEKSEKIVKSLINDDPLVPIFWTLAYVIYTALNDQTMVLTCMRVALALNQYDNQNWMILTGLIQKKVEREGITKPKSITSGDQKKPSIIMKDKEENNFTHIQTPKQLQNPNYIGTGERNIPSISMEDEEEEESIKTPKQLQNPNYIANGDRKIPTEIIRDEEGKKKIETTKTPNQMKNPKSPYVSGIIWCVITIGALLAFFFLL